MTAKIREALKLVFKCLLPSVVLVLYLIVGSAIFLQIGHDKAEPPKTPEHERNAELIVGKSQDIKKGISYLVKHLKISDIIKPHSEPALDNLLQAFGERVAVQVLRICSSTMPVDRMWTYSNMFYFAANIVSSVGFSNVHCMSDACRRYAVFYALLGVPLYVLAVAGVAYLWACLYRISVNSVLLMFGKMQVKSLPWYKITHLVAMLLSWFVGLLLVPLLAAAVVQSMDLLKVTVNGTKRIEPSYATAVYLFYNAVFTVGLADVTPGSVSSGISLFVMLFLSHSLLVAACMLLLGYLKSQYWHMVESSVSAAVLPAPKSLKQQIVHHLLCYETKLAIVKQHEMAVRYEMPQPQNDISTAYKPVTMADSAYDEHY